MTDTPRTRTADERKRIGLECAARLIRARVAAGMSSADLARALDVTPSTLSDYESGTLPNAVLGGAIERTLGVAPRAIYHDDPADVTGAAT